MAHAYFSPQVSQNILSTSGSATESHLNRGTSIPKSDTFTKMSTVFYVKTLYGEQSSKHSCAESEIKYFNLEQQPIYWVQTSVQDSVA